MNKLTKLFFVIYSVTHVVLVRMVHFALRHPLIFKYSKLRQTEKNSLVVINDFTDEVIRKRRQELIESVHTVNNNEDGVTDNDVLRIRKKRTLLDILLLATIDGKPLSDEDIREEVDVFMFGVRIFISHLVSKEEKMTNNMVFLCRVTIQSPQQ